MKFLISLISLFLFISISGKAQNRIVIKRDTLLCHIDSIHARGVSFTYEGDSKTAALDIVNSIYISERWLNNAQIRQMAISDKPLPTDKELKSFMYKEKPLNTPSTQFIRAGKSIQISGWLVVGGGLIAGILAKDNPEIALIVGGTLSIGGIIALINGGIKLQKAGELLAQ